MSIIPFPVCAYAAIHYEGRRLMNEQAGAELGQAQLILGLGCTLIEIW